jgi:hypothetical protein
VEFSNSGTLLSGSGGYSVPGVEPITVAFDGAGDAWMNSLNSNDSALVLAKLNSSGGLLSSPGGYQSCTSHGIEGSLIVACFWSDPSPFALDGAGNVWSAVAWEMATNGPNPNPTFTYGVGEMSNTGTVLSGATGYTGGTIHAMQGIAIDGGGDVWVLYTSGTLAEFIGAATPVVTPFSLGVKNGTLGLLP